MRKIQIKNNYFLQRFIDETLVFVYRHFFSKFDSLEWQHEVVIKSLFYSYFKKPKVVFVYIFLAGYSVLATPLLTICRPFCMQLRYQLRHPSPLEKLVNLLLKVSEKIT